MPNGIIHDTQIEMTVPPITENNVVRLKDMREYFAAMTAEDSRVILTAPFDAIYDPVAKTLTQNTPEDLEIDGIILDLGDRVIVKSQLDPTQNGVYVVTVLGEDGVTQAVLTRANDFKESYHFINGMIFIQQPETLRRCFPGEHRPKCCEPAGKQSRRPLS